MKMMKIFLFVFLISTTVPACNTVDGIGEDLQEGGDAVRDAAN